MDGEHIIRLRGGWQRQDERGAPFVRISLPLPEPPRGPSGFHLVRQFGQPPLVPGRERLWLRLERVAGVRKIWLDDQLVAQPGPRSDAVEIEISPLGETRHRLVLEVEPEANLSGPGAAQPWGIVALVVRSD